MSTMTMTTATATTTRTTTTTMSETVKSKPSIEWSLKDVAKIDSFTSSSDGINLVYASLIHPNQDKEGCFRPTIVFFTGWKETFVYYEDLFHELYHEHGFNVFTMDHRSQGLSDNHPGMATQKGHPDGSGTRICHVDDFETSYVADAEQFLKQIVKPAVSTNDNDTATAPLCVVGFSMGGIMVTRLGQKQPPTSPLFDRLVAVCPMYRHKNTLDLGGLCDIEMPLGIARKLASLLTSLGASKEKADGRDTNASITTTDLLTHCPKRIAKLDAIRKRMPNIVLAGCSWGWVHASFCFEDAVLSEGPNAIHVPMLVVQAEDDSFVYNSAHADFVAAAASTTTSKDVSEEEGRIRLVGPVAHAYHQLWMEQYDIRTPLIHAIASFAECSKTEQEPFPKHVVTKLNAIPVVVPSGAGAAAVQPRWPRGHHSGSSPPFWPVPLVFRERTTLRNALGLAWKGAFIAVMMHCMANVFLLGGGGGEGNGNTAEGGSK